MTDPFLKFDPLLPYWLLAIVVILIIALLVWFEVKKTNRYKMLRICCVIVLGLALLGICLQPKIQTEKSDFKILLTENFTQGVVDSLEKVYPGTTTIHLEDERSRSSANLSSSLKDIDPNEIKFVVGDGLNASARDAFDERSFIYRSSPSPHGTIDFSFPESATSHVKSTIAGVYNNHLDSAKIVLEGPGGKEDSVLISKNGVSAFSLSFTPRQKGNFTYTLSINDKKEIIPITVSAQKKMKILFIQMFPTFETGYLKNVLSTDHHLVFRYQLSKNNFRYEYINHPTIRTDRLTKEILDAFDLVVVDTDALKALSASEKKNLETSVDSGLGVFILLNENPKSNKTLQSILPITFTTSSKDTAHFTLVKKLTLPVWPVKAVDDGKIIPTIHNRERILAGYSYQGFGKIGFQLLQETYKLTLEGDSASYKNLWTSVLQKNARTHSENFQMKIENEFPVYANEPVIVQVIGSSANAPTLLHNGIEIPMIEDVLIDDVWKTKVWPDKSGWQELRIKGDSSNHSFYVSNKGDWKSLAAANSIRSTKAMASSEQLTSNASWEYKPFAPWIFYLMFLMACAALWLVPKI